MSTADDHIPAQRKGNQSDTLQHVELKTKQDAEKLFHVARTRLLDMSNWSTIADGPSSEFQLTDSEGNEVERLARQGDKFKIDLPAPGSLAGHGHEWVEIENISDEFDPDTDTEITSITVRPTQNPKESKTEIAHFFTGDSSSTFLVKRVGNTVSAEVHGRNEVPNTHSDKFWDIIRHVMVAMGAIFGFAKPQWKNLVDGLIDEPE